LRGVMKGRTSIIVSHRVSTVRGADQILVLAGGASWSVAHTTS
jgi:ABC-type multidrug transport system fused ATPase/permease subunit